MEKVKLFEADIDVDGVIKKSVELKDETIKLRQDLKALRLTVGENNEEYVKTEARLKKVQKEYRLNQQQLTNLSKSSSEFLSVEQKLNIALEKEVKSISNAKDNNKELRLIRNEINTETEEGAAIIELINSKLDENTELIRNNSSALERLKLNIGNYKEDIKGALNELNPFNGGLTGFIARAEESGGAGNLLTNSLRGIAQGFAGLTKSALTFLATPIGALLGVLVGLFLAVRNAMSRSEEATNKISRVFSVFSGIINKLLDALAPLGEFLIDGIVVGFELAARAAESAINIISNGLRFLGFDSAADSVQNWSNEIKEGAELAIRLADAEARLQKEQRKAQLTQLEYQRIAEQFRQIRDNENLSIRERIKANEDLGDVLREQLTEELKIAELALQVTNLRIEAEGRTTALLDEQAQALVKIAEIQERITSQESEQLTNRVALQKEAADKAKEIADKAIAEQRAQLDLFIEQQGTRAKTLEESLQIAEEIYKKEIDILKSELANRNKTQTEFDAALLKLKNDLLRQLTEASIENFEIELEEYIRANQSKLDSDLFFSDESLRIEQDRLNGIAEQRRAFEQKRLDEGVITEQEYNRAINQINEENRLQLEDIQAQREEAQREKEAVDLANKLERDRENLQFNLDLQLEELDFRYQREIEAAEKTGADVRLIEERYANLRKQIEESVTNNKLSLYSQAAGNIASIVGEQSAIGKVAAITQTTIDTYQSATAAYKALAGIPVVGPALGKIAAAAAIAGGLANVKRIASTQIPRAEHGLALKIGGKRHSQGGTKFFGEDGTQFEAEKDERLFVLNRKASAAIEPLLSDFNQMYGGVALTESSNYLASGGEVLRDINNQSDLDINRLTEFITEGVREGSLQGTRQGSTEGTYSGIVDREENISIEAGASF